MSITFDPTADYGKGVWRILETTTSQLAFLEEKEIDGLHSILSFKDGSATLKETLNIVVFVEGKIAICNFKIKEDWKDLKFNNYNEISEWTSCMWRYPTKISDRVCFAICT